MTLKNIATGRKKQKLFAVTMDLEPDYAGVVGQYRIFEDLVRVEELLSLFHSHGIKLTVFSLGEIFELFPHVIKLFEKYGCEIECHSYSHNFNEPDSDAEIESSKRSYFDHFGKNPRGYRAPRGKISTGGIKRLEQHGFLYDSSIFPSYFPNPFKYLLSERKVHYHSGSSVMEIPFTAVTPLRVTLSISYIKLLSLNFFKKASLPDVVCFGSHLHDFIVNEKSYDALPLFWRLIYSRNKHKGIDYCVNFLDHVRQQGYRFCFMSEIYNSHIEESEFK